MFSEMRQLSQAYPIGPENQTSGKFGHHTHSAAVSIGIQNNELNTQE